MKYFLMLMAMYLCTSLTGQPYLNETSLWKQYYRYSTFPPGIAFTEDIWIQLEGDTLIGSTTYHRVLKTGLATTVLLQDGDTTYQGPIHEYLHPIREVDQYIYAYDRQAGNEYLLYDFGAAVGDTLESGHCERDTVVSIDTVYLGDIPRKRFHLPFQNAEICTFVEGIGPTFGFGWQPCNTIPDASIKLQCYSQDGNFIQFDPGFDCSGLVLANEIIKEDRFSINPNPFTNEIEIHFSTTPQQTVSLTIVNMMGVIVLEKQLWNRQPVERIFLSELPAGMYIVCIKDKQEITSYKLIKQ